MAGQRPPSRASLTTQLCPGNIEQARCLVAFLRKGRLIFAAFLEAFVEHKTLYQRVLLVLDGLPNEVQRDFLDDPRFRMALETYVPGQGWSLLMHSPGPIGSDSRCIVLRPRLGECSEAFACYVIAHELAHAYLRHGGWGEITDIEEAADALAAHWGFPRPRGGYA